MKDLRSRTFTRTLRYDGYEFRSTNKRQLPWDCCGTGVEDYFPSLLLVPGKRYRISVRPRLGVLPTRGWEGATNAVIFCDAANCRYQRCQINRVTKTTEVEWKMVRLRPKKRT